MDISRKLYQHEMQELAQLIAVISERSFRRGWQQGIYAAESSGDYISPAELMYSIPVQWSPDPESGLGGMPSINRLHIESGDLMRQFGISFEHVQLECSQ
jgi:hypothetical protein